MVIVPPSIVCIHIYTATNKMDVRCVKNTLVAIFLFVLVAVFFYLIADEESGVLVPVRQNPVLYTGTEQTESPFISAAYLPRKPDTLTRLASEFVDEKLLSACPSGSVMVSKELQEAIPLHNDCPEVFIIGVRKGGTTAMLQYLSKHPHFEGALLNRERQTGESSYFTQFYNVSTWDWYTSLFPAGMRNGGESTVSYFTDCDVPKRIWENCGNRSKIVLLLRNPKDRYQSNFLMRVYGVSYKTYRSISSIKSAIKSDLRLAVWGRLKRKLQVSSIKSAEWLRINWSKMVCLYDTGKSMLFEGYYYVHLMNWLCNFPSENILILNSEEFYRDTAYAVNQVMEFLSLAPLTEEYLRNVTSKAYNAGHHEDWAPRHRLDTVDKSRLGSFYLTSNGLTLRLLDWHHATW